MCTSDKPKIPWRDENRSFSQHVGTNYSFSLLTNKRWKFKKYEEFCWCNYQILKTYHNKKKLHSVFFGILSTQQYSKCQQTLFEVWSVHVDQYQATTRYITKGLVIFKFHSVGLARPPNCIQTAYNLIKKRVQLSLPETSILSHNMLPLGISVNSRACIFIFFYHFLLCLLLSNTTQSRPLSPIFAASPKI